ncbi:MAG: hypothetical protein WCG42_07150 [Parachlamydiaceae bacterium]
MSSICERHTGTLLSLGCTTLASMSCQAALHLTGVKLVASQASFVAGVIFGAMVELCQQRLVKEVEGGVTLHNFSYGVRSAIILIALEEQINVLCRQKIFNSFEFSQFSQRSTMQSIAFFAGVLSVQLVAQTFVTARHLMSDN